MRPIKSLKRLKIFFGFVIGFSILMSNSAFSATTTQPVTNKSNGQTSPKMIPQKTPNTTHKMPQNTTTKKSVSRTTIHREKYSWKTSLPSVGVPVRKILGDGWKLSSTGGIAYENPKDKRYWVKFSGVLRLDQTFFSGTYRDRGSFFPNSGFVRLVETYVDSGLGDDWLSTFGVTWGGERVFFTDTMVGYTGFCENNEVNAGRISGNWFGLEGSSSTSWNPFMERSLQNSAFYPGDGFGILTDFWWPHGQITLLANQPDHGARIFTDDGRTRRTDRWRGLVRATYAPVVEDGYVWHFGVSYAHRHNDAALAGFLLRDENLRPWPGLRSRHDFIRLVFTGPLLANYADQYNVEMAHQCGPFMLEGEFTEAFVHRKREPLGPVSFNGYSVQTRYLLTGEFHEYDVRDGAFGKININSPYGAHEICLRYDFINLNSKNVFGGSQHNVSFAWNWFINQQVRFSFNYIRGNIRPSILFDVNQTPRRLDMFGLRIQVRFK